MLYSCGWDAVGACVGIQIPGRLLNESGTDKAECCRKVDNGRKVAGNIRSLARGLQLECTCLSSYMVVRKRYRTRFDGY